MIYLTNMTKEHFVHKTVYRRYSIDTSALRLEITPDIFPPSTNGLFLAKQFSVRKGETVIDIGTGSGILAITAAKRGGIVYATDQDPKAIRVAQRNAHQNNVLIKFKVGKYFANFRRKFDVIIANLPQEIIPYEYRINLGDTLAKTIDGGTRGNRQMVQLLKVAKQWMRRKSRMYFLVNSSTDYISTLSIMVKNYDARLIAFSTQPMKGFVDAHIHKFERLHKHGLIHILKKRNRWYCCMYLFELMLKKSDL